MYRNSFVLWFCMSQSYPVEFLQTWNQQICLKPLQTKRRPAAIDGLEVLQGDDCTWNQWSWYGTGALPDGTTGSVTWSCKRRGKNGTFRAQMEWKIGTWKCLETKKIELELSKLWWNCKLIVNCLLPKICKKVSGCFAAAHRGMDMRYWCHHVPTRLLQVWANQTLGVVYLKYVALMLS